MDFIFEFIDFINCLYQDFVFCYNLLKPVFKFVSEVISYLRHLEAGYIPTYIPTYVLNPLEQFEITPFITICKYCGLYITDASIHLFLVIFYFYLLSTILYKNGGSFFPNFWSIIQEKIYGVVAGLISENVRSNLGQKFLPLVFSIFYFLILNNAIGLVPYTFTSTSHIVVTFFFALSLFIGLIIISVKTHGLKFFSAFLPSGTPLPLAFLLVVIELISYVFKPISLSIRLFANIMAGHSLLKVIAGFSYLLMASITFSTGILGFASYLFPILVMFVAYFLELGVALIQSFVFTTLFCIYLNDALNLH